MLYPALFVTTTFFYSKGHRLVESFLNRFANISILNSHYVYKQIISSIPSCFHRSHVIENTFDPVFPRPYPVLPDNWPFPDSKVALIVGRFAPEKNHLALLNALHKLYLKNQLFSWKFLFIGDGPLLPSITLSSKNSSYISILPSQPNISSFYQCADLLILPSLCEGFPNVALESQACGPVAISLPANRSNVTPETDGSCPTI